MTTASDASHTVETDVLVPMRDGVILRADLYRPHGPGDLPVLLCRTPYNKRSERQVQDAVAMAQRGYLVVVQDVRGRDASDGEWQWMFGEDYREAEDGYDTVEWAAALPGSTGKVGTFGLSYDAWLQWELATLRPPHLVAMVPVGIATSLLDMTYGIFETGRRLRWCYSMAASYRCKAGVTVGPQNRDEANAVWNQMERDKWLWFLPFDDLPADEIFFGLADQFRDYLRRQNVDTWRFREKHTRIDTPALSITGWYDRLLGTKDHFLGMRQNGFSDHGRTNQKLIIGPWGHTTDFTSQVGVMDFGPEAALDYYDLLSHWFDYWLKGIATGVMDEPPVRRFLMGENRWYDDDGWPPAAIVYTDYYFHSQGRANTPAGDGRLALSLPQDEPADHYTYDPRDPVMTLCTPDVQDTACDQRPLDYRQDVLVYQTRPLATPVEVTGDIVVKLFAASSAVDTDFTAKLVDVHPDGLAVGLCYGILRVQYRESYQNPSLIVPGQVYKYTISLRATSNLFAVGHRIRVDISSSNFPFFDRNHNTGLPFYADATLVKAEQTVLHSSAYPSRIILPVVPRPEV
ncbi:MAG: CocE/NonD family hydrolase [Caldilineaceae bacterium]